jgi:hypothetical protein
MSFAPPAVASPTVRPPTTTVAGAPPVAPAAPRLNLPSPPVAPPRLDVPVAAVRPPGAVVLPSGPVRAPGAVVLPSAPDAAAPVVAAAPKLEGLAQALPDTDDEWDDMLNALEADGPGTPL